MLSSASVGVALSSVGPTGSTSRACRKAFSPALKLARRRRTAFFSPFLISQDGERSFCGLMTFGFSSFRWLPLHDVSAFPADVDAAADDSFRADALPFSSGGEFKGAMGLMLPVSCLIHSFDK